jgi:small subunit ribosomal protein S20
MAHRSPAPQQVAVANIKSQIKRNRQTEKRNLRNRKIRSEIHTRTRSALSAIEEGDDAEEAVRAAMKRIDKAAQKGVLHKNTAARRKARLARRLNAAS